MSIKIISVDFKSQFGFLKKIDTNSGIYFTYNIIHKPALMGILGAIVGLKGIYQSYPNSVKTSEYWEKLQNIKMGIQPLNHKKGLFDKTVVTYNNSVGYANDDGNLIVTEQILIKPNYKIYLKLDLNNQYENQLYENLKNQESVYIPYLGKNDFQLWWDKDNIDETENFTENIKPNETYKISSIFMKNNSTNIAASRPRGLDIDLDFSDKIEEAKFAYFENLPFDYNENTGNYNLVNFIYTNYSLPSSFSIQNLYQINRRTIIQLF